MPTIDLTDEELATVTAAIRRLIEVDKFPNAPRVDRLRSALAKLDAAALRKPQTAKSAGSAAHNPQRPPTSLLRLSTPPRARQTTRRARKPGEPPHLPCGVSKTQLSMPRSSQSPTYSQTFFSLSRASFTSPSASVGRELTELSTAPAVSTAGYAGTDIATAVKKPRPRVKQYLVAFTAYLLNRLGLPVLPKAGAKQTIRRRAHLLSERGHTPGIDVISRRAVPTIDLTDAEHAAAAALIKRAIEEDRFPSAQEASGRG